MTQDQFQVLRTEMKEMEVRLRDHSFNGHKSIWSNIGGVEERISNVECHLTSVEGHLSRIEGNIKIIKDHLLNGHR